MIQRLNQFQNALLYWLLAGGLLMATVYVHYLFHHRSTIGQAKASLEQYLHDTEDELEQILADDSLLCRLAGLFHDAEVDLADRQSAIQLAQKDFTLFIYHDDRLVYWSNDQAPTPPLSAIRSDNPYFQDQKNLYRLTRVSKSLQGRPATVAACIPFRLGSNVHPYGHIDQRIPRRLELTTSPSNLLVRTADGDEFIYLKGSVFNAINAKESGILIFLYGLAFLFVAVLVQRICHIVHDRMGRWAAIGFLLFTVLAIRGLSLLFDLTGRFTAVRTFQSDLMAPAFEASLGDMLINAVLLLWVSLYVTKHLRLKLSASSRLATLAASFSAYFIIALVFVLFTDFAQKLIQETSINFNFDSVFNLDRISIQALLLVILLLFSLFVWSAKLSAITLEASVPLMSKIAVALLAIVASLPVCHTLCPNIPLFAFALVTGICLLLLDVFLEAKGPNFTWIVLWLVVLSGFSSILLYKYNKDEDEGVRLAIAKALVEQTDTVALAEIAKLLKALEEPLAQASSREAVIRMLEEGIAQSSSYLTHYYQLAFPDASVLQGAAEIDFQDILFYHRNKVLDHYVVSVDAAQGTTVLAAFNKQLSNPYLPLPSLVPVSDFKGIPSLAEYDYAIYQNRRCIERSSSGHKMVFEGEEPMIGRYALDYPSNRIELTYNNGSYLIVVGRRLTGLIKPVSLFSYLFVTTVLVLLSLLLINAVFTFLPADFNFNLGSQISLRNKIQVSVLALIVLSFVIIGLVTVFYFRSTAEKSHVDRLEQTASSLQQEIQASMETYRPGSFDSVFVEAVPALANKYNTHIQYFDAAGMLKVTSDHEALKEGLTNDRMSVVPLINIKKFGETLLIHDPVSMRNTFKTVYFSLVNANNDLLGFVGLPVYPGSSDSTTQVKEFMGTLLNVYVFLLLIAGAFALAVANSITRPMTVLGQKLKEFKLGRSNEPLEWKTNDELGVLIQEYNQMIVKLDESADLLALTEREVAWREMAKQVAHEIKNPLTPMRLSIQHLQHAMQNADPIESRQLVQRVGITLIEQIDNLSKIAAEFSTFAKMPRPQYERIVLNDLVTSVHDLFKKRDDMDFNLYVPIDEIYVNADRSHLLRVLNNLIKNAIQAIPASRRGVIDIKLEQLSDSTIIQVRDNGKGISKDMRDKVFYPNFTTKTSGTGLGLAISKNIVESFGGRMYFETEEGSGTTFFFELPLLRNVEHDYHYRQILES